MPKPRPQPKSQNKLIGDRGEKFVCHYLEQKQWQILATQWRCRYGEIDIIALAENQKAIAFVEVKTRGAKSLDAQGLLAITPSKQQKIIKTALQFLSEHPQYADYGCRFDVALVTHRFQDKTTQFSLDQYLESAFEADID